jgi:hypothetical protein
MSTLYMVAAPDMGDGAWIGFRLVDGKLYWVQSGDEWQRLLDGGSLVQQVTSDAFTQIIKSSTLVGSTPPSGYLSGSAYSAWTSARSDGSTATRYPSGSTSSTSPSGSSGSSGSSNTSSPTSPSGSAPSGQSPSLPPQPDPNGGLDPQQSAADFMAGLEVAFPWLAQLGLGVDWFRELAAIATSPDMVLAKLRETRQYRSRFAGIFRADGTLRMNERQYLDTESNYRQLLTQFGFGDRYDMRNPLSLIGFFEAEIDPNELRDRLQVYKGLEEGSQFTRDAFYVYAGLDVSVDDLFMAVVDPAAAQRLRTEYNSRIASQRFDYETFITRATELGLKRVAQDLQEMQARGAVTGQVVQRILNTAPEFARQIMDAIYTGGSVGGAQPLSLQDLISSFEHAALGAAASQVGLELPSLERVQQIREAGIQRTQALRGYQEFAKEQGSFTSALQRIRGDKFGQDDFEKGAFLGDPVAARNMAQAMAGERAAGLGSGTFRFDQNRNGGLFQRGLKV